MRDMADVCFRVNSPSVIYERFDDELVAIHLDSGSYHSMFGAAADAFVLLAEEATAVELADALAAKYAATSGQIETALAPFLEQLQTEKLVVRVETRKPRGPLLIAGDKSGLRFTPPTLQAFHDLENLLLLDPIHEVGDEGWPQASGPQAK
jgi:coenzyme PQQ synthesis protein D (PqqD)